MSQVQSSARPSQRRRAVASVGNTLSATDQSPKRGLAVIVVSSAWDTGGQGSRIAQAFAHEPGWNVRSMAKSSTYMSYPPDLPFRRQSLEEQYQLCDVIHVRNKFDLYDQMAAKYGPKPVVIHWHGSAFRGNPEHHIRQMVERGAIGIVSTLDLWLLAPDLLTWLPAPYDVDELKGLRQ